MKKLICYLCQKMGALHEDRGIDNEDVVEKALRHTRDVHPEEAKKITRMSREDQDRTISEIESRIVEIE